MGVIQKQSVWNTLISYLGIGLGYANVVLLLPNFFEAAEVGLLRTMMYIAVFYAQLSSLGSAQIILKYFPYFKDKIKEHNGIMFWGLVLGTLGFTFISILFVLIEPVTLRFFSGKSPLLIEYLYYIIPLALSTLLYNIFEFYLRSLKFTVFASFSKELLLRFLISIAIALFALGLVDFKMFVLIYVGNYGLIALTTVFYLIYVGEFYWRPRSSFFKVQKISTILNYGMYTLFSNTTAMMTTVIDSLMLAAMLGLREVGIYTTAFFITSAIMVPARSLYKVTWPYVSEYWVADDMERLQSLYKKVTQSNLIFGSIIFIGIWINKDNIFALIPTEYAQASLVILLIGIGRMVDSISGINGVILTTSKLYRYDLIFSVLLAILTVFTNYLLIPRYGINGAAFATALVMSLIHLIRLIFVGLMFKIHPFQIGNLWVALIGGIVLAVNWTMPYLGNLVLDILIRSAVATVTFFVPIYLLKLSTDLNEMIKGMVEKTFSIKIPFG